MRIIRKAQMNKHSFLTRRNVTFAISECPMLASELMGWIIVNITHLTEVGLWLWRGPKCMLCKANTIPAWVETAGVSVWEHQTQKPRLVEPFSCLPAHLPKGHQHQSVGGTEMTQSPGSLMAVVVFESWWKTINQAKTFKEKFRWVNILKKKKQASLLKTSGSEAEKTQGSQNDCWLSQNWRAELNLER